MKFRFLFILISLFGASGFMLPLAAAQSLPSKSDDLLMIEGLRQRQLFDLAEQYAATKVVQANLAATERVEIGSALIQTYAEHALNSKPKDREALWNASEAVSKQFIKHYPDNPRSLLIQLQATLSILTRAELIRQEAEVQVANASNLNVAKQLLRKTLDQLKQHQLAAEQLQRSLVQQTQSRPEHFTLEQIVGLLRNIETQKARAYINQALCYPSESLDRINSLSQALLTLQPLLQLEEDFPGYWENRLTEIRCQRLIKRYDVANQLCETVLAKELSSQVRLNTQAEQILIQLDSGNLSKALAMAEQGREIDGKISPLLDFAIFKLYLALWQKAEQSQDQPAVERWQANAVAVTKQLEQYHGAYWSRRAELLLTKNASNGSPANLDLLVKTADGFYRQGRLQDALSAYDQVINAYAAVAGEKEKQLQVQKTAAAISAQLRDYANASARFREIGLSNATEKDAAKLHLMAAYYQSLVIGSQENPDFQLYQQILEENYRTWPTSPVVDQTRFWLAKVLVKKKSFRQANQLLMKIQPNFKDFQAAVLLCRRATLQEFAVASKRNQLIEQDVTKAIRYFEQIILVQENNNPQGQAVKQIAAETAAELWLHYTSNGYNNAQSVIEVALRDVTAKSEDWQYRMQSLLVIALAGKGLEQKARETLSKLTGGSPEKMLQLLEALSELTKTSPEKSKKDLANLQAVVIEMLSSVEAKLPSDDQLDLQLLKAEMFVAKGEEGQALKIMKDLASSNLQDSSIQLRYAEFLSASKSQVSQKQSLLQWRYVASKSRPQTDLWYRSKYEIARSHYRLGDKKEAANVIRYLKTLYPELGGPDRKRDFESLYRLVQ